MPVWGKADPGEKVTVAFANQQAATTADQSGKWMVSLKSMPVSNNSRDLRVSGKNKITVSDILVGDVWLGMGQSNMDFQMYHMKEAKEIRELPPGTFDGIRVFIVSQATEDEPQEEITGGIWNEAVGENIMQFSATMFYFGRELQKRMPGVPLGLIRSSVGATNLYSWVPNEVQRDDPSAFYLRNWCANAMKGWSPEKQAQREREKAEYEQLVEAHKARGEKIPDSLKRPDEITGPKWSRRPSGLYNGMIAPIQPMALRGVVWYQGEWDCKQGWTQSYHDLFLAFAKSLRGNWAEKAGSEAAGDFPIYIVQLPAREEADMNAKYWPYLRDTQRKLATEVPDAGYVVTFDTNDPSNMHPFEKQPVGERLALFALGKEYGKDVSWYGPEFKKARRERNGLLLDFDTGGETIVSKDGEPLRHFQLAGSDGTYHPATAEIRGKGQVFVSSPDVPSPKTVRYAFMPAPVDPNFHSSSGLPAESRFRTDEIPVSE